MQLRKYVRQVRPIQENNIKPKNVFLRGKTTETSIKI